VNADAAKKFRIGIPLGDFVENLKAAVYTYVGIDVRWKFAQLTAANTNENG
jgi:hypothetical protein